MNSSEKYNLITRNLQEVVGKEELKKNLNKQLTLYWGTMPTGSPHFAYFLPLIKIKDFLEAGLKVKILIADLHAALDGVSWEILEKRQKYYETLFPEMLKALGINTKKLEFIKGSKLQLNSNYFQDVLKMSMQTTTKDTTKAASEVVKMTNNPKLGNLIYPIMQALDEQYLKADIQFGGVDQRKILVFAREFLPKVNYKPRIELMNPMMAGLTGEKMSASVPSSKIDILDDKKTVANKIRNAEFKPKDTNAGIMQWLKYIIFPIIEDKKQQLIIKRDKKFGGDIKYNSYEALEKDFISNKLHPLDIKNTLTNEINKLLEKVQKNKTLHKLHKEAYN